jgi:hypothetical protein
MRERRLTSLGTAVAVTLGSVLAGGSVAAQTPGGFTRPVVSANVPRTPDGKPDMQGIWDAATITPLERPAGVKDLTMAEDEMRKLEGREVDRVDQLARPSDPNRAAPKVDGNVGGYNYFWIDPGDTYNRVDGQLRTSLIVDPPDGRIPPLTPDAQQRLDALAAIARDEQLGHVRADSPQSRSLADRCILGFNAGPPMTPGAYNNYVQITQAPGLVTLLVEMVHDVRVVPVDGRPRLPSAIRQYKGDSRGRWEGRTLVIETTNFLRETRFRGSSANLNLVERFTRIDANTLLYEFTVNDPRTWTRPWTAAIPMKKVDAPIYEYACHEGNYALRNILAGARAQEK